VGTEIVVQFAWLAFFYLVQLYLTSWIPAVLLGMAGYVARVMIYYRGFNRVLTPVRWEWFWFGLVCNSLCFALAPLLAMWLIGLMIRDRLSPVRYSWLHWVGVLVGFFYLAGGGFVFPTLLFWDSVRRIVG
jgi:hypothetical protein